MSRRGVFFNNSACEHLTAVHLSITWSTSTILARNLHGGPELRSRESRFVLWGAVAEGGSGHSRGARRSKIRDNFPQSHSDESGESGITRGAFKPQLRALRGLTNCGTKGADNGWRLKGRGRGRDGVRGDARGIFRHGSRRGRHMLMREPPTSGAPPGSHALAEAGHDDNSRTRLSEIPQGGRGRMRNLATPYLNRRIQSNATETTKQIDRGGSGITCLSKGGRVPSSAITPRTVREMAIRSWFKTGHNPAPLSCSGFNGGFNARWQAIHLQRLRRAEAAPFSIQIAA